MFERLRRAFEVPEPNAVGAPTEHLGCTATRECGNTMVFRNPNYTLPAAPTSEATPAPQTNNDLAAPELPEVTPVFVETSYKD